MYTTTKSALLGAAIFASMAFTAQAADILPEAAPEVEHMEPLGGWYLRGDIGYQGSSEFDIILNHEPLRKAKMDHAWTGGIGVGYRFSPNFRADATLDFIHGDIGITGRQACQVESSGWVAPNEALNGSFPGICEQNGGSKFRGYQTMANAYYDFATFEGFTPYLGAGIGATHVSFNDHAGIQTFTIPGHQPDGSDVTYQLPEGFPSDSGWRFSYALMAGASFKITQNMELDFGYKYSSIQQGGFLTIPGTLAEHDDLENHTFRIGVRAYLW